MARIVEKAIELPEFSKLLYELIKASTPAERAKCSPRLQKAFHNDTMMRNFAYKATFERQLEMCCNLGLEFYMIFAPDPKVAALAAITTSTQYENIDLRLELVEAMKREKVFMVSSADLATALFMTAQNAHTKAYHLSQAHISMANLYNLELKKMESINSKMEKISQAQTTWAKQVLTTLNSEDFLSNLGLEKMEMRVLMGLFLNRNTAMSLVKILELVGLKKYSSTVHLGALVDKGYIGTNEKTGPNAMYYLTTKGRQKVFEYLEYTRVTTYEPE